MLDGVRVLSLKSRLASGDHALAPLTRERHAGFIHVAADLLSQRID